MIFSRYSKYIILVVLVIFVFLSLIRGYRYYMKYSSVNVRGKEENSTVEKGVIKDVSLEGVSEDKVRWKLHSESAKISGDVLKLERLAITYKGKGKDFTIEAKEGEYNRKELIGVAYGNVTIKVGNEGVISTEKVVWYTNRGMFCFPIAFRYVSGRMEISGSDACYYTNDEVINIKNLGRVVVR